MLRSVRIVQQQPTGYSIECRVVQQEYCDRGDTVLTEEVPTRDLSEGEVDLVQECFRVIEIRKPNPDPCQGEWGSFHEILARWDTQWWTEDCRHDHLSDYSSGKLNNLADSLWARSETSLHNMPLHLAAGAKSEG
jgi:hypothetical protein